MFATRSENVTRYLIGRFPLPILESITSWSVYHFWNEDRGEGPEILRKWGSGPRGRVCISFRATERRRRRFWYCFFNFLSFQDVESGCSIFFLKHFCSFWSRRVRCLNVVVRIFLVGFLNPLYVESETELLLESLRNNPLVSRIVFALFWDVCVR